MARLKKEVIVMQPEDTYVEPANNLPAPAPKKVEKAVLQNKDADKEDYKEAVRFLRKRLRGFAKEYFEDFEECWNNIKDPQKKAQMYLDACKILMPAQSVIDIDIGVKESDSFTTKLLVLRDQAEILKTAPTTSKR